jgi:hypothetical protein
MKKSLRVDFFEEFPEKQKNLEKIKLIDFDCVVYLASKTLDEFLKYRKEISAVNKKVECAWWPLIKNSYWISSFSKYEDLEKLVFELKKYKFKTPLKVLLDLELPLLKLKLFVKNLLDFRRNKKLIKSLFIDKSLNIDIRTAEYPFTGKFFSFILGFFGVIYSVDKYPHKKIVMYYSSMIPKKIHKITKKRIIKKSKIMKNKLQVAIGTIAIGILGNEPILKPKEFEKDLKFCSDNGIRDVVVFRLGGLDKKYLKIIKKFVDKTNIIKRELNF